MTDYVMFKRTSMKNRTVLPKQAQSAKEICFFVKKQFANRFPKRFEWKAIHMADIIIADGHVIKNVVGPIPQNPV